MTRPFAFLILAAVQAGMVGAAPAGVIEYRLDLRGGSPVVTVAFDCPPGTPLRFEAYPWMGASGMTGTLEVSAGPGQAPAPSALGRTFRAAGRVTAVFRPELGARNPESPGRMGYLSGNGFLAVAAWVLPIPVVDGVPMAFARRTLAADLPPGWTCAAGFDMAGEGDAEAFYRGDIGAGRFIVTREDDQVIAVDRELGDDLAARLTDACLSVAREQARYLRAPVMGGRYLSLFLKGGPDDWQYLVEGPSSAGEVVQDLASAVFQFGHRLFHARAHWAPGSPYVRPAWFMEGGNQYLGALASMESGAERPFATLARLYADYLAGRERLDGPIAGPGRYPGSWNVEQYRTYAKATLVCHLLDLELRKAGSSFEALVARVDSAYRGSTVDDEVIRAEAAALAGRDLSAFFDAYVDGTVALTCAGIVADADRDGLPDAAEAILATDPLSANSDGDGRSDLGGMMAALKTAESADVPFVADGVIDRVEESAAERSGPALVSVSGGMLYVAFDVPWPTEGLRAFLNVDRGPGVPVLHYGVHAATTGDRWFLAADGSAYGFVALFGGACGLAGLAGSAEFLLPLASLGGPARGLYVGVVDTRNGTLLFGESIPPP